MKSNQSGNKNLNESSVGSTLCKINLKAPGVAFAQRQRSAPAPAQVYSPSKFKAEILWWTQSSTLFSPHLHSSSLQLLAKRHEPTALTPHYRNMTRLSASGTSSQCSSALTGDPTSVLSARHTTATHRSEYTFFSQVLPFTDIHPWVSVSAYSTSCT